MVVTGQDMCAVDQSMVVVVDGSDIVESIVTLQKHGVCQEACSGCVVWVWSRCMIVGE